MEMISKEHLDSMKSKIEFYQQFGYIPVVPLIDFNIVSNPSIKHDPPWINRDEINEWIKPKPSLVIDLNTLQLRLPKYK